MSLSEQRRVLQIAPGFRPNLMIRGHKKEISEKKRFLKNPCASREKDPVFIS